MAIGTLAGGAITATFYDLNGNQTMGTPQPLMPQLDANGQTSFMLDSQFPSTANNQGAVVFTGPALIGLGLRASPYGTLTTLPVILQ